MPKQKYQAEIWYANCNHCKHLEIPAASMPEAQQAAQQTTCRHINLGLPPRIRHNQATSVALKPLQAQNTKP